MQITYREWCAVLRRFLRRRETPLALKPADFYILLVLADAPLHGYGLLKEVARQSGGAVELEIGSLYRLLDRLILIVSLIGRADARLLLQVGYEAVGAAECPSPAAGVFE